MPKKVRRIVRSGSINGLVRVDSTGRRVESRGMEWDKGGEEREEWKKEKAAGELLKKMELTDQTWSIGNRSTGM